jgi:O6-methylguanine-DNA--protein-cysteine methyltransferase
MEIKDTFKFFKDFSKPFLPNIHNASMGGWKMKTFADKAYDLLRKVPKGRVTTYKEIAHALGTRAYRGVGQAMRRNPYAPEVP